MDAYTSTRVGARVIGAAGTRLALACIALSAVAVPPRVDAQTTTRVNVATDGTEANEFPGPEIRGPGISADGRVVAFTSYATNLVPDDTNGVVDVFVRDRLAGKTTRVSVATGGTQANASSSYPALSASGRYVAFNSEASNLVPDDTNGVGDIFVHDRTTSITSRVSVASNGAQGSGGSHWASLSADGRFVAFSSLAPNLVIADTNGDSDVFVHDRTTGVTTRVSVATDGAEGTEGSTTWPTISADGRIVLFQSSADNLVPGDTNRMFDTFLHDRETAVTTRVIQTGGDDGFVCLSPDGTRVVAAMRDPDDPNGYYDVSVLDVQADTTVVLSIALAGAQANGGSLQPSISADGRFVVFTSGATNLVPGDTNDVVDVFLHDRLTAITTRINWVSDDVMVQQFGASGATISADGKSVAFFSGASIWCPTHKWTHGRLRSRSRRRRRRAHGTLGDGVRLEPAAQHGRRWRCRGSRWRRPYERAGARGGHTSARVPCALSRGGRDVGGLRHAVRAAQPEWRDDGAAPVPEGRRHERGPGDRLRWPGRATLDAKTAPGLSSAEFATVIECRQAHRRRSTDDRDHTRYGSHAETAVAAPSTTWYLAEGATHHNFSLFYLVQNPNPTSVPVTVTYLLPAPAAPLSKVYTVPAQSRFNIWVNNEGVTDAALAALAATDVSAVITAPQPILVERAMYLNQAGPDGRFGTPDDVLFNAGHESAGVKAPALSWFLAEGATGPYFDEFILIANPGSTGAQVQARYLLVDGTVLTKDYVVPAASRFNIWVNEEDFPGMGKALADAALSATLTSTNGVPIVVERSMWWPRPSPFWMEAHNSAGTTATGTTWGLAEGEVGGPFAPETYILIANTSPFAGTARVTLAIEGGGTQVVTVPLPASSRTNVPVIESWFPGITGKRFGALIESLGDTPAQIVVERAMYSDANGVHWAAGTGATATRLAQ